MSIQQVKALFDETKLLPFPSLGKTVGDFPLYDALLMGLASSYLDGKHIDRSQIPTPDPETEQFVMSLRQRSRLDREERLFLEYSEALEALKRALREEMNAGPIR
jgi:hypothetical protein